MNSLLTEEPGSTSCVFYSAEELSLIDPLRSPKHVAVIMDGNRRWAKEREVSVQLGHWQGADVLTHVVRAASHLKIEVLTVFGFSTENWKRNQQEIDELMDLFRIYLIRQKAQMVDEGVRLSVIGDCSRLPADLVNILDQTKAATAHCGKIELILALNYGGRDDIRRALVAIIQECEEGRLTKEELSEELISHYLDTARWGDPDLLIRTSGERRLSNFLMWQMAYTEIYHASVLWPNFTEKHLLEAVLDYQGRERRIGGI